MCLFVGDVGVKSKSIILWVVVVVDIYSSVEGINRVNFITEGEYLCVRQLLSGDSH